MWDRLALGLVLLALAALPAAAGDRPVTDFFGDWRGVEVRAEGVQGGLEPKDLDILIAPAGDGFRARWTTLERGPRGLARLPVDATFTKGARPGVFAFKTEEGSLLGRLFASPATGNPLEGETLLWARVAGDTLTIYSLGLNEDGGFDLHRTARTLENGQVAVVHTYRIEDAPIMTIDGRLERSGG